MQKYKKSDILFAVIFFMGFMLGILFINLSGDTYFRETAFFGRESFLLTGTVQIDQDAFFLYLLRLRGKAYLALWLFGYTVAGIPILLLALGWLGFALGVLLTMSVVQMHMAGVLVFLASVLPQAVIYMPLILMLAGGIYEKGCVRPGNRYRLWEWPSEKGYILVLVLGIPLTILGTALEAYANPWVIGQIVKFFL